MQKNFSNFKNFLKQKLIECLIFLSKKNIQKYKPYIIAITGNVGKTTTKEFVAQAISAQYNFRASEKSYNSEIGIPLTILGEKNNWDNIFAWIKLIFRNFFKLFFINSEFPKVLVLEIGADKPFDILNVTKYVKPNMVILTAFAENPVHAENFPNRQSHIQEKKYLVEALSLDGILIYNSDDEVFSEIAKNWQGEKKYSFGKKSDDLKLLSNTFLYSKEGIISGIKVSFDYFKKQYSFELQGILGLSYTYASLAGFLAAEVLQKEILSEKKRFEPEQFLKIIQEVELPKSRLRILEGKEKTILIDDTYNSSPKAVELALETIQSVMHKGRKVIALGHMAELGENSQKEHIRLGNLAANVGSFLIFVGRHNEWYLEGIRSTRFNLDNVFLFENSKDASDFLEKKILENDLILIKGSQSARMEKVAQKLLQNISDSKNICRNEKEWKNR